MKKEKDSSKRLHRKFTLRWGAPVYAVLLLYALIMTQLLRNPISAVFFWFILIIGPLSFFLMLLGKALIQVYVFAGTNSTEKFANVDYEIRVINQSPLPYPFVEALITQPSTDAYKSLEENLVLSLIPFGGYNVKRTVSFSYRGLYEIGVREIYITDILHIFRMRVDIDNFSNVTVAARQLEMRKISDRAVSDIPTPSSRITDTRDMSEIKNIREYIPGDPIKNIHWKLSAKSEDTLVKDFSTNTDRHTYIFVDMSRPVPSPLASREKSKKEKKNMLKSGKYGDLLKKAGEDGAVIAKSRISGVFSSISEAFARGAENRKKRKNIRRRAKGISQKDIETIEMIDEMINSTSGKASKALKDEKKQKKEALNTAAEAISEKAASEKNTENDVIKKLLGMMDDTSADTDKNARDAAVTLWGGVCEPAYADSFPEFCADGVAEIAVSAMLSELREGNYCTVVWFASDNDGDICRSDMTDSGDFHAICNEFATAPVVSEDRRISTLTDIIGEALNVTVKIVTSNIDPQAISEYCSVPRKFGGAGTGCAFEILLFNPTERYEDTLKRIEYTEDTKAELKENGITVTEIVESVSRDGSPILTTTDLI